jgi:TolB protein
MKQTFHSLLVLAAAAWTAAGANAQQSDIVGRIVGGQMPVIALPDLRGSGEAQAQMDVFNRALYDEIAGSSLFKIAAKSLYPLRVPQQPADFQGGSQMADWSRPPVSANWLAFGYTAVQNGQLVLFGYLYDVTQQTPQAAQAIGKLYFGPLSAEGARKTAREFAADILARFGAKSLAGSKIYFVSDRSGTKEIWSMDYDGSSQTRLTQYGQISFMPAVSKDNTRLAFTQLSQRNPAVMVHSLETNRRLPFVNPQASVNASPDFTPDGKQILFSSSLGGGFANIFIAGADGRDVRRLTSVRAVETEPKVNPKTGADVVMTSGRSGHPQIYRMSIVGTNIERLTSGEGDAVNPSWHPDGEFIAFAWTRGFEIGNFNIFVMDVVKKTFTQLTHGVGRNENPTWAPDGRHLVFTSTRGGKPQIFTMLAGGTRVRQLTFQGNNTMPVWSK